MSRYTAAYSSFVRRLDEVKHLSAMATQKERLDAVGLKSEINALCRGGIVLLSSHLEAYVKELGETLIDGIQAKQISRAIVDDQFFYYLSKDLIDEIRLTQDPEKFAAKIFNFLQNDQHLWSKSGPFPGPILAEKFNRGFSNPAFKKITKYFNRFGYAEYKSDLAQLLKADFQPTINMVDHLVDTRNKIAHGDPQATKTPSEVGDMTRMIQFFCQTSDSVFGGWAKSRYCSIR